MDKFEHSMQVAIYADEICLSMDYEKREEVAAVAILHDVLEDASDKVKANLHPIFGAELSTSQYQALKLLTKEDESYVDYIKAIRKASLKNDCGEIAYIVKLADMKDHLSRVETLTDRLKEKYLEGLRYLI
jgi:HD superfamily phosphodiesterase